MTTPNRLVPLTADGYTLDRKMRLVPVEMTDEQHRRVQESPIPFDGRAEYSAAIAAAPSPDPAVFAGAGDALQCDEEMLEKIRDEAVRRFRRFMASPRGQQLTVSDSFESWLMWTAWEFAQAVVVRDGSEVPK